MTPDDRHTLPLEVNGEVVEVSVRGHHTLLDVLRRELDLYGARPGCTAGVCGSCTVLLDGAPVSSCLLPVEQVGTRAVRTIEDLARDGKLHPVQQAFIDHTAFQCSYCTPGFILTAVALLAAEPDADRERIRTVLAGNLCRCGSYVKILEAVLDARDRLNGHPPAVSPPQDGSQTPSQARSRARAKAQAEAEAVVQGRPEVEGWR